ncbi:MAG: DUF433 domain-containing protein [Bacteroidota bacterium]|jgi:uncharacterized protein (DUF433 family)|nr:DUF433 domain-containing protein [Bacteroidota bacterium]
MEFENQLKLGIGIYTPSEVARILRLPYYKVNRWIDKYWDGELGKEFECRYSWKTGTSKAVSFHTLIEFYVLIQFAESGVKTRQVLEAHKVLSSIFKTAFPFALKEVLDGIKTDGKKIFLKNDQNTITLDGTKQFNLDFIKLFFKNLEFDSENLASRFWPMGRDGSVVIDPERKFGHPVISDNNIYPETLFSLHEAGDPINYLAHIYDLTEKQVNDAINYCKAA